MHKPLFRFLLATLMVVAAAEAGAQSVATPLPAWDELSPAQRESLVAPVRARWDSSPDERARMLERAQRWQAMTPGERERARKGMRRWKDMSPETQRQMRALHGRLRALPDAERTALRERWQAMTPVQRSAWAQANPPPPRAPHPPGPAGRHPGDPH